MDAMVRWISNHVGRLVDGLRARLAGAARAEMVRGDRLVPAVRKPGSLVLGASARSDSGARDVAPVRDHRRVFIGSFLAFVLAPTILVLAYNGIIASDVYVSEVKVMVRAASDDEPASGALSLLDRIGRTATNTVQDAYMILEYLKSRAAVQDVGGRDALVALFSDPAVDYFSRLPVDEDIEGTWTYWRSMVTASVDTLSGILTVRVRAFTPETSLQLADQIVQRSEDLVNRVSERSRRDAVDRAREAVDRAAEELAGVRANLLAFQQDSRSISPVETASRLGKLISDLTLQKVEIEGDIAASTAAGIEDGPGNRFRQNRLAVIEAQIAALEARLYGADRSSPTVSRELADFELLKLEEEFAEYLYTTARSGFEEARRKAERQQSYLVVVVPPLLPDEPRYPEVLTNTVLTFAALLVVWAIISLVTASVRDHMV